MSNQKRKQSKPTKQQQLKQEYRKQRKRITRQLRDLERRGYVIQDRNKLLPNIPQRITQGSINRLSNITLDTIYNNAIYVNPESGEVVTGKQGKKIERKRAAQRAAKTRKAKRQQAQDDKINKTDLILRNFSDELDKFYFLPGYEIVQINITKLVDSYGADAVANGLELAMKSGYAPSFEYLYLAGVSLRYISVLTDFIASTQQEKDDLNDAFDALINDEENIDDWDEF